MNQLHYSLCSQESLVQVLLHQEAFPNPNPIPSDVTGYRLMLFMEHFVYCLQYFGEIICLFT